MGDGQHRLLTEPGRCVVIDFVMPALGSDMDEGTLNEWLVKPGDVVTRGQVVAVVETTKAAVEVECWHEGTVSELLVPVGQTVRVGTTLARLAAVGETVDSAVSVPTQPAPTVKTRPESAAHGRRWISPAARRLAASKGLNVDTLTGTGPGSAVTLADVERAPAPAARPTVGTGRATAMRASIAAAMSRSKREIPHFYLAEEIHMDRSLAWLDDHNRQRSITERLLPAVLQVKAVGLAAARFPEFNGFWREGEFCPATGVHVGVAISLRDGGLVAPAIHDVPTKPLDELMKDLTDLVSRARAGSLRSSEMADPSLTVTNLGDQGVDSVFGVIYPPQVALVGFGRTAPHVCAVDGAIRIVDTVQATLSADHRAGDGHRGALFLGEVRKALEDPESLVK